MQHEQQILERWHEHLGEHQRDPRNVANLLRA
jgi:hypothetical protein